jgi:hypothetical protein
VATDEPAKPIRPLPEAFAGAGLGLLAGLLLGLSVSQVVGGFVAALSALLAGFLGLTAAPGPDRAWRIGAFGLACAAGVLIGLAIRSGALLAPSVDEDVREWQRAGYPTEQALAYVAFARLGVKPQGATVTAAPAPGAGSNVLFADKAGVCARLERLPPGAQLRILAETGEAYAALATAVQAATNTNTALAAGLKSLCG